MVNRRHSLRECLPLTKGFSDLEVLSHRLSSVTSNAYYIYLALIKVVAYLVNSFLKNRNCLFFQRMLTGKVNTPVTSQLQNKMGKIDIDLRSDSLAVSIRCQDANTTTMYDLSKLLQSNFRLVRNT